MPATVVVAAGASKPTLRNVQANTPGEVSETRNQSPRVATVAEPPGGVRVPGGVTMTEVLFVVDEAAGRAEPTVYPSAVPTEVTLRSRPVLASMVPASSMLLAFASEVIWSCRFLPCAAVRARVVDVLFVLS
jgi:hypothetical protein